MSRKFKVEMIIEDKEDIDNDFSIEDMTDNIKCTLEDYEFKISSFNIKLIDEESLEDK